MPPREKLPEQSARLKKTEAGRALLNLLNSYESRDALVKALGVKPILAAQWVFLGRVSKAGALLIEQKLGISRQTMRPDLSASDWSKGPSGRPINQQTQHDNHHQLLLVDLANHYKSVRSLCEAIPATVGQFHNWKSRGRIAQWALARLSTFELPTKLKRKIKAAHNV